MKNIVNRALVAKKKQFQSKSVPRGTRTIWRYLGALFILFTFAIGNVWGTSYIPGDRKVVTADETIDYATIAGANATTSGKWIVNPRGGTTSSKKYTNLTTDTNGNPNGIVDNIATITSNVNMATIQVPSTAKYNQNGKYVIHMRITGITGIIAHGVTGSSGRGCAIYGQEYSTSLTENTEYGSALASMTRGSNSGSFLLQYTGFTASKEYLITIAATGGDDQLYAIELIAPSGYSVTYDENGHGANQTDLTGQTKLPATLPTLSETGWIFGGWFTDEGLTEEAVAGATISKNTTLYAKWTEDDSVVKYSVTYDLNGPTGSAPTQEDVASGVSITLADAPSWAGHAFDGWLCNIDSDLKAAGSSYTMTAAPTTFTAQWHELDCKIFSLTGGIGSAVVQQANATVNDGVSLILSNSDGIIKLSPASGSFNAGDIVTISGTVGNTTKEFGVKISNAADKKATLGTASVAGTTNPMVATATLSAASDYLYICRTGGTTQTILTCEVHRACAEGAAAGLSYANATVNKLTTDAAFTNALTNTNGLVIAGYTSSNAEVATVDKNGQVTLVGAGEATITAHSAIQTKAGTLYAAGTASYTLTVATPPTFTVTYAANGGEGTMTDANTYLEGAEVTLLDNTFTAPTNKIFGGWVATYNDGTEKTLTITNGKFTMPAYDVTVTAQWVDDNKVAKIGDIYYTSLEGAEGAFANVADGQTIELLKNCDVTSQLEIAAGVTATIDLAGYKIEYTGTSTLPSGVILVHNGASLTINDSSDPSAGSIVSGDKAYAAVALTKLGDDASNPATLVVNGGALTGYYYGITGNGSRNNTDITINGGTITGTVGIAIYHPQVGTLTVNDGSLTGVDAAIEMRAGTLVINDGTFTATATEFSCNPNGSGSTTSGAAIAIAQHTTKKEISVTINGGTFNGVKALNESNPQVNDPAPEVAMEIKDGDFNGEVTTVDVNNFISGGTFDHEVAANQCAENYTPKDNGDGTYGVKPLAQTFSLEDLVTNQGTGANYTTYLNNLGWTVASADALDKLNTDKDYDNYPYLGLKFKNAAGYVAGEVEGGKLLTIKLGHMAGVAHLMVDDVKKMELDGVDAETPKVHYYYVENTANVKLLMANAGSSKTCVLKAITVADPFTVTFDANGGEDVASLNGTPTVTLPSATKGTDSFLGWFDGETKVGEVGDTYTPTANITLVAHWEAVSTDARLASISFSSDAGTLSPAFDPEVTSYTYTMPYGTASVPTITGATAVNANAQAPIIGEAATAWGSAQTVKGVAQSGAEKTYTITMVQAPKDGVCIIKGNVGNNTFIIDEDASLFAGTADKNNVRENSSTYQEKIGWKFQARPARLGLTLSGDETFQEGDVVEVFVTSVANIESANDKMRIFDANEATAAHLLYESEADMVQGVNRIVLPATTTKSLYLHRTKDGAYDNFNPFVAYVAVYRPMNPVLTAITINGRDGVIDEANKTVAVQIPYEADLAALTVVPTIVWNEAAASNSIVVNDGSAWIEGANTYKLTDKDGDATTYTITVARDVLKHAVKFYDGETLLETVEVEDGTQMAAGDVPADPTKEDYLFQGWAETDGGAVVDVTSFTISATKNFYAKWAADGAIKLINKTSGAVNEDGYFITGVTATEANSEKAATWGGTQGATISGTNQLNKVVQYNATTNQTKLQIKVYNTNNSDKYVYIHKIIEGKTTEESVETLTATSKTVVESEFYEFNDTKNRSFYITTNSADVKILQVKVIDDGATPMKQAGEAGYSLNLNKGRVVYYANSDVTFEGLALQSASNYSVISSSEFQTTKNISFSISSPVLLKVTTNSAKYYVSQNPDEDGTTATAITAAGTAEFELTETTNPWYLVPSTTSNVKYTNIAFELPKAEAPVIETQPATKLTFDPGNNLTATVVADAPSDGGTLSYQWYNAANDEEVEGATEATLTTTTPGTYYVVVTNTLAGHQDVSVTSEEAELGYRVTSDATLMALSYGGTAITLEDGVYNYNVELAKGTTNVPALSATATMDGYATVTISNAAEFVNYEASSTVTVKSEDLTETNVYTVNFYVKHDLPQVDVTATTTWNWANAATTMQKIVPATKDVEQLMANIDDEGKQLKNDAEFNSQALIFSGQEALEKSGSGANTRWFAKGGHIKFNVTVPGIVEVEFSDNGNNNRRIKINNAVSTVASASNTDVKTYKAYVQPGEVMLMGVKNDGTGVDQYIRISKITFTANPAADYTRNVSNNIGTLCVDHNVMVGGALGATFYQIASRNELYNDKIDFEEVLPNEELKAGEPYIFHSNTGKIELFYGETVAAAPVAVRGMIGSFADANLPITEENKSDILYIAQNKLWNCEDLVGVGLDVVANRAYIVMSDVPTYAEYQEAQTSNPAPRRRVTLGRNAEQVATGIEDVQGDKVQCTKMLINGQLFILRGEKMYDAKGQLVK